VEQLAYLLLPLLTSVINLDFCNCCMARLTVLTDSRDCSAIRFCDTFANPVLASVCRQSINQIDTADDDNSFAIVVLSTNVFNILNRPATLLLIFAVGALLLVGGITHDGALI
jgi:hypothetical protein